MPFVYENVKVELFPGTPPSIVYLSENDVGDTIAFELVYKGQPVNIPNGSVVSFKGTKKDGLGFTVNSSNVSGNVVKFKVSQDMTSCSGVVEAEISITLSNNKHGTCNVILIVEKNPHSDGVQDGSYPQIISEMRELVEQIEGDAETASNAAHTAVAAKNSALEIQQDVHQYTASVIDDWLDEHPEATTTVQDGAITEVKLNTDLYQKILRTESVMHFFPSLVMGGYSGNSSLMVVKDKCVLFDCGISSNWDAIKAYYDQLYADGIFSNIDYIIISHYHGDHIQCLSDILERYPHDGCVVYLPLDPTGYITGQDGVMTNRTAVINILQTYNLTYYEISQDTELEILDGFCTIELFNSTPEDYTYYQGTTPDIYNNFCMCALVKIGEVYALYPGDIQRQAQIRICNTRVIPKLVLYSTHHHAIQNDDYIPYLDMINPEFTVVQTNYARQLVSAASSFATNYACEHVYSCAYQSCAVAIGKDGGSVVDGRELPKTGWYYSYVDYYVDNTYTGASHTGEEAEPFTNINEALMFVRENSNMSYRIHIKATDDTYEYVWCRDYVIPIALMGYADGEYTKPKINGLYVRNCNDLSISNCDFTGTGRTVNGAACLVYSASSHLHLSGCEFNNSGETFYNACQINLSEVYATSCSFKNFTYPFLTYRFSDLISNGNTFISCSRVYGVQNMRLTIRGVDTLTDCTTYIYAGNAGSKDITIKSVQSDADLSALQSLIALNDATVVSNPFYCNGVMSAINGKSIVPIYSPADRGIRVADNGNLNDYTAFGKYQSPATSTTITLSNTPPGIQGGFTMYVEPSSATYSKQIIIDNNMQIFIRRLSSGGVWGSWFLVGMTQL